jgi:hypothetical protein
MFKWSKVAWLALLLRFFQILGSNLSSVAPDLSFREIPQSARQLWHNSLKQATTALHPTSFPLTIHIAHLTLRNSSVWDLRILRRWICRPCSLVGGYIPTKASGYLHESTDVSFWPLNRMVGPLVQFLAAYPFALVAIYRRSGRHIRSLYSTPNWETVLK